MTAPDAYLPPRKDHGALKAALCHTYSLGFTTSAPKQVYNGTCLLFLKTLTSSAGLENTDAPLCQGLGAFPPKSVNISIISGFFFIC